MGEAWHPQTPQTVTEVGWWFDGKRCEQDELPYCARCKPHDYPMVVYMTRGWSAAFHRSPTCEGLQGGQDEIVRRCGGG